MNKVTVIGGGAAGCFFAAELSCLRPDVQITILEKGPRLMAKLALTGGGRCNLTNSFEGVESLAEVYPRGDKLMRRALGRFSQHDCMRWFESEGVRLVTQPDHCVFPASQDAMQIVRTLERRLRQGCVAVRCRTRVDFSTPLRFARNDSPVISTESQSARNGSSVISTEPQRGEWRDLIAQSDAVVLTTGGATSSLLQGTGIELVPEVPSLFTFTVPDSGLRALMGTVVEGAVVSLAGTNFRATGPLLLTDWGVSGPAVLRLSSYAARHLAETGYKGTLLVNWLGLNEKDTLALLGGLARSAQKMVANTHPSALTERLWRHILLKARIREDARWAELGSKGLARLAATLRESAYPITGRAAWKEEFVTCGGVSLKEVRPDTMESRRLPGLYFAGEVLDIDAVTGGFNLQAAWSTAYIAAHALAGVSF